MEIEFLSQSGVVTGSKHLLKTKEANILIDCGLYQGLGSKKQNLEAQKILSNTKVDAIILTHAHLDHCGYIPKLYKDGFRGKIFCTKQTMELSRIIMLDNARIQSQDAKKENKKIEKEKLKIKPMYSKQEVEQVLSFFETKDFKAPFKFNELEITLYPAGHILGASCVYIKDSTESVLFSGDLGRPDDIIMPAPDVAVKNCDHLVIESTYGNRYHKQGNGEDELEEIIEKAQKESGCILIPAFSLGRSQLMMKVLSDLFNKKPHLRMHCYIDSAMTREITEIYKKNTDLLKVTRKFWEQVEEKFNFIEFKKQRDKLDKMSEPHIIITASGMLSGGNILGHLDKKGHLKTTTLLIVGFQAPGTLGYELTHPEHDQNLYEDLISKLNCEIKKLDYYSSHADKKQLIEFIKTMNPKNLHIVHGELEAQEELKQALKS